MNQKELDRLKAEQPDHKHAFEMKEGGSKGAPVTYPTSEDIKRVVRAAKKEAHEHAQWLARRWNKQYPGGQYRAIRGTRGNIRFGYATDDPNDPDGYDIDNCDFKGTTYPTVKFLKEWIERDSCATNAGYRGQLLWIEFEISVRVSRLTVGGYPRRTYREEVWDMCNPVQLSYPLWAHKDKGGSS